MCVLGATNERYEALCDVCMYLCMCLKGGNNLENCTARSYFILGECIWRKITFRTRKPTKLAPFLKVFLGSNFRYACQKWNLSEQRNIPVYYPWINTPTCLRLKFSSFREEKNGGKLVVTFELVMQFGCSSRFRILTTSNRHKDFPSFAPSPLG